MTNIIPPSAVAVVRDNVGQREAYQLNIFLIRVACYSRCTVDNHGAAVVKARALASTFA